MVSETDVSRGVELTDARAMRALAHPVRIAILEVLHAEGTATPTECGRQVGESPQSCSYHLRSLAKYGLVRRAASEDGRETRWELAAAGFRFSPARATAPEVQAAAQALAARMLERDDAIVSDYLAREHELDADWRDAAVFGSGSVYVTVDELRELQLSLERLLAPYRRPAPADRPDGARRVHVLTRAVPRLPTQRRNDIA
jgi:DNA-binding transcriptional ArsR family regulator